MNQFKNKNNDGEDYTEEENRNQPTKTRKSETATTIKTINWTLLDLILYKYLRGNDTEFENAFNETKIYIIKVFEIKKEKEYILKTKYNKLQTALLYRK